MKKHFPELAIVTLIFLAFAQGCRFEALRRPQPTLTPTRTIVPTRTQISCPTREPPIVCPTVIYHPMPDAEFALIELSTAIVEIKAARDYASHLYTSIPGDFHGELAAIYNLMDTTLLRVELVEQEVGQWQAIGYFQCEE